MTVDSSMLSEEYKIVNCIGPIDIGSAAKTGDSVKRTQASRVTFIVTFGIVTNAPTILLHEGTTAADAGAAIAFKYRLATSGDTLGDLSTATSSGVTLSTANNQILVIEVDDNQGTDTDEWLHILTDDPAACLVSCIAILGGLRYQGNTIPTQIV